MFTTVVSTKYRRKLAQNVHFRGTLTTSLTSAVRSPKQPPKLQTAWRLYPSADPELARGHSIKPSQANGTKSESQLASVCFPQSQNQYQYLTRRRRHRQAPKGSYGKMCVGLQNIGPILVGTRIYGRLSRRVSDTYTKHETGII